MVAGGGGRICDVVLLLDQIRTSRLLFFMLCVASKLIDSEPAFPAKQPPPATVPMVAGGGDLMICLLKPRVYCLNALSSWLSCSC